jgi:hypothetical protein
MPGSFLACAPDAHAGNTEFPRNYLLACDPPRLPAELRCDPPRARGLHISRAVAWVEPAGLTSTGLNTGNLGI